MFSGFSCVFLRQAAILKATMITIRPPRIRSFVSSLYSLLYTVVIIGGYVYYFTHPLEAAEIKGTPIAYVFMLAIPGLIFALLNLVNNFTVSLMSDGQALQFSSLFKRIRIPLSEIQKIQITSPDLIETNLSGPTPKPIRFSRKPIALYVGMNHVLHITKRSPGTDVDVTIGPGWNKSQLQAFVLDIGKK